MFGHPNSSVPVWSQALPLCSLSRLNQTDLVMDEDLAISTTTLTSWYSNTPCSVCALGVQSCAKLLDADTPALLRLLPLHRSSRPLNEHALSLVLSISTYLTIELLDR